MMPEDSKEVLDRVNEGLRWVDEIAKWLPATLGTTSAADRADFAAVGRIGLLEAARAYCADEGSSFKTYARIRIKGAMRDWYRQTNHVQRPNPALVKGAAAGDAQAARARSREALLAGLAAAQAWRVMAQVALDTREHPTVAVMVKTTPEEASERNQHHEFIDRHIGNLPTDEAFVVRRHYFDGIPIAHIAEELGISRFQARGLHENALERLEKLLGELR